MPAKIEEKRFGWAHAGVIIAAILLRVLLFPRAGQIPSDDEAGYLSGSLCLLEGYPAGYRAAPAGPNTWVGWIYAGGVAARHFFDPGAEERAVPASVRAFVALNHALFDQYRDLTALHELWIVSQILLSVWATSAAFRLGRRRGGLTGALLLGGFAAVLPMYVSFSDMSRPYMTAWAFGILSLHAAVCRSDGRRVTPAAIFLGLAIASRVEMLLLVPVTLWEFWFNPEARGVWRAWFRLVGVTLMTALLTAPWLLTQLIANLRTIATVRLGPNPFGFTTLVGVLWELVWHQGLLGALIAFAGLIIVLFLPAVQHREEMRVARGRWLVGLLGMYVIGLLASLARGTVYIHQQGPVILVLIVAGVFTASVLDRRWPIRAPVGAGVILLIPLLQTLILWNDARRNYAPDLSVAWVEANVAPGTRVYLQSSLKNLLPTPSASDALWEEVTNIAAGDSKFKSGLRRFGLSTDQIPRAMSDENLVQERGNRRGVFILGSRPSLQIPRFDIQYFNESPVFGVHDIAKAFAATGGVVIKSGSPLPELGKPVMQWVGAEGQGTFVYSAPMVPR